MEFTGGKGKFPTAGILMGAVVTASGTGAEMNAGAVINFTSCFFMVYSLEYLLKLYIIVAETYLNKMQYPFEESAFGLIE